MGAYVDEYRGSPASRFSIGLLHVKIKSFLPPPEQGVHRILRVKINAMYDFGVVLHCYS